MSASAGLESQRRYPRGGRQTSPFTTIARGQGEEVSEEATVVTPTARHRTGTVRFAARRAGHSKYVDWLARAGFGARGLMYVLIGVLAIEVAFGNGGHKADQS